MRNLAIVMLAVTLVIGLALIAEAQQRPGHGGGMKPPPGMPLPPQQLPEEVIKEFDKDGDGKLSPEELKVAREELHKRMLKEFDKDGDGKLSDAERQAMNESLRAKFAEGLFKKTDTDGNGELSLDELKAALKKIEDLKKEGAEKKGDSGDAGKPPVGDPEAEGKPHTPPPPTDNGGDGNGQDPPPQQGRGRPGHSGQGPGLPLFPPLPLPEKLLGALINGFTDFDKDKSGGLSLEEFKAALREIAKRSEKPPGMPGRGGHRGSPPPPRLRERAKEAQSNLDSLPVIAQRGTTLKAPDCCDDRAHRVTVCLTAADKPRHLWCR
jgi:hypothetical protein